MNRGDGTIGAGVLSNLPHWVNFEFCQKEIKLKNLILKGEMEPSEPERATEAREARRSSELY